MQARVLLLEDDPAIARTVAYALERAALQVTHSLLLQDARALWRAGGFDLLVLDVGLPDGSGLDLCREVRAAGNTPVLILSAQGDEIDRVLGLELGADDYLPKPFSPRELTARVRALLRRAQHADPAAPDLKADPVDGFRDDRSGQRISWRGQPLALTRREYRLLSFLLAGAGRIYSRDALLTAAWGSESDSTDRTVDTHIKTLRAKLRQVAPEREFIATHRGMGYSI